MENDLIILLLLLFFSLTRLPFRAKFYLRHDENVVGNELMKERFIQWSTIALSRQSFFFSFLNQRKKQLTTNANAIAGGNIHSSVRFSQLA